MDDDTVRIIIDKLNNIENIQRDGCRRLTKLETNVENHLSLSKQKSISKTQKFYFAAGIIGSYAVGIMTSITNGS
jgi:hypothetical protein